MKSRLLASVLPVCALLSNAPGISHAQQDTYTITGVRFAGFHGFPVHELVHGADTARRTDLAFIVWVIRPTTANASARGRVVLFDAGFYRQKFIDSWKPTDYARPSEAVERAGIKADQVTDIIVSHIHWDHLDGADLFPKANVWLERAEYEHYVGNDGRPLETSIDTADAKMLFNLHAAGRIRLIDHDSASIVPGITAYTGGRHTFASDYIGVRTAGGEVILASDNVYMYENVARHVPIGAPYSPADTLSNLRAQDRMTHLATKREWIIPGHDPEIFSRFPQPGNGVAEIK